MWRYGDPYGRPRSDMPERQPHPVTPHHWPTTPGEARRLQERLRGQVICEDRLEVPSAVAGLDVHYAPASGLTWAAAAVVSFPDLMLIESALACRPTAFPYVPGLLSFREAPAMLEVLGLLSVTPDLLLIDGQGLAHARRFGLACHVGLLADIPAIGVAKSRLVGAHDAPGTARGASAPLTEGGETLGSVLRTRADTRPVYVSVGHRLGLATAVELVLRCAPRFRLPEPLRLADRLSRMHRR